MNVKFLKGLYIGLIIGGFTGWFPVMTSLLIIFLYDTYGNQARFILTGFLDKKFNLPSGFSNKVFDIVKAEKNIPEYFNFFSELESDQKNKESTKELKKESTKELKKESKKSKSK